MGTHTSAAETAGAPPVPLSMAEVDHTYRRLRELTETPLTPEQREMIRATLAEPFVRHAREVCIALEALDGPDPEMAIVYLLDSIPACRSALSLVDARLSSHT